MARVFLHISEPAQALTLRTLLQAEDHSIFTGGSDWPDDEIDVVITDDAAAAVSHAQRKPTLVLTPVTAIRAAVEAMRHGVHGYITLPPQPHEAHLMVQRALNRPAPNTGGSLGESVATLHEVESQHIRAVLRQCRGNRAKAARLLGIGRNTLWRKLKAMDPS
jgi:DNA-binding NtrC family response regulator